MQAKEPTFFSKLIDSIKAIEKYPVMAISSTKEVLIYFILFLMLFSLIFSAFQTYDANKKIIEGIEYLDTQFPNLYLKNSQLYVDSENEISIKPNSLVDRIIVNTNDIGNEEKEKYEKILENEDTTLIVLKNSVILKNKLQTFEYGYDSLGIVNLEKQDIINYFSGMNLIKICLSVFILFFVSTFIVYFSQLIVDVLCMAFIGYITAIILRLRLRFIPLVKMSVFSFTLPMILRLIYLIEQNIWGFEVKYFDVIYITISYIYIVSAILMIKSDLIKKGEELTKIIEKEQELREKIENEKEQEKEEKNQEKEEKKEKNQEKEKEKSKKENKEQKENREQEENNEEEPQGENA